jgi:8-oxo-dGTP diphosphatase
MPMSPLAGAGGSREATSVMPDGAGERADLVRAGDGVVRACDDVIRAAGAVVWRPGGSGPDVALVHRPRYDDWSFPKGKRKRGEHEVLTAVREVREETGLRVVLGRPLAPSVYQVGGRSKVVSYWVARRACSAGSGESAGSGGPAGFVPGAEVDRLSWLPAPQARRQLSYDRDVALLDEFLAGPASSTALIVLRHAEAAPKSATDPGDLGRPLDARGVAQARLLTSVLACYGRCRVVSSAAERCLATVRPYAEAVGAPVEAELAFTEPADAPWRAWPAPEGVARELAGSEVAGCEAVRNRATWRMTGLATSGVPALVCAHRENLPWLIEAAFGAFGVPPPDGPPLAKGSFWVLQSAGGVLVSSERHDIGPVTP